MPAESAHGQADRRYVPRKVEFETLLRILVEEHAVMKSGLSKAKDASERNDYEAVAAALRELDPIFRQHITDEESQILRLLIGELGAKEEIRVFQQHRPIHRLMQLIGELASKSGRELENERAKLDALFAEHTTLEEGRVFPKAMTCHEARRSTDRQRN